MAELVRDLDSDAGVGVTAKAACSEQEHTSCLLHACALGSQTLTLTWCQVGGHVRRGAEGGARAHLEGQVGGDGDAGAQVHVAMPIADEQRGVALGLRPHRDAAAVVRPRPQPACNGSSRGQRARASVRGDPTGWHPLSRRA